MTKFKTRDEKENALPSQLYIAIDHLKKGRYQLNIINENKIVSFIEFKK